MKSIGKEKTMMSEKHRHEGVLAPGATLGQYKIVSLVGRGGMGEVYEVEHTTLGRRYALKLLTRDLESRPHSLESFRREARVMANLEHPNIVRVDDFGETDGRYWLRMELAEGIAQEAVEGTEGKKRITSLQQLADAHEARLPQEVLLTILKRTLGGLSYAHEHGAIHRDLKPSNILLGGSLEGGPHNLTVKIGDFGLVRMMGEKWVQTQAERSAQLSLSMGGRRTRHDEGSSTRSLLGTYEYMSPEQKRGEEADERSDIYALGLMTFKLLTGRNPSTKPPSRIDTELARGWDDVVAGAMEEKRSARIASCGALLELLNVVSTELGLKPAQPASRYTGRKRPAGARKSDASAAGSTPETSGKGAGTESSKPWTVPDLGMELRPVTAGSFRMGSNGGDSDEKPAHTVEITRDFWLGKCQVTQAEYEALLGTNPSYFKGARHPVETVRWEDAAAFCARLTEREATADRLPAGYEYRLPTEAEWEYAARGGAVTRAFTYAGSDYVEAVAWFKGNGAGKTHPVGEKKANELGLHDMSGNVWEWCLDWYDADYYGKTEGESDPVNLEVASSRAVRGGGWVFSAWYVRTTNRDAFGPLDAFYSLGFRVCLGPKID